jgi:hypothetical protein
VLVYAYLMNVGKKDVILSEKEDNGSVTCLHCL